jgi:Fe-S-cluster containining protein
MREKVHGGGKVCGRDPKWQCPGRVKKLKVIPPMHCDTGCGKCCGVVPATETEFRAIQRFIAEQGVAPAAHTDGTCPFYQNGGCAIYPVRPLVCRLFGHSADPLMTCPLGYNVNIPERDAVRMIRANGKTTHLLHELAPNYEEIAHLLPKRDREPYGSD